MKDALRRRRGGPPLERRGLTPVKQRHAAPLDALGSAVFRARDRRAARVVRRCLLLVGCLLIAAAPALSRADEWDDDETQTGVETVGGAYGWVGAPTAWSTTPAGR